MITMLEDRHTAGIVKVTLFADTFTEMMEEYKVFPTRSSYYNANIQKNTLRFCRIVDGSWSVKASYWTTCE